MPKIDPKPGKGVDYQTILEFKKNLEFIVSKGMKPRYMAIMMGKDEGNWNSYMSGAKLATHDIIMDLATIFVKVLEKKPTPFPEENITDSQVLNEPSPYTELEKKLADIANEFKLLNTQQKNIEKKLDQLLEENAKQKPPEQSS